MEAPWRCLQSPLPSCYALDLNSFAQSILLMELVTIVTFIICLPIAIGHIFHAGLQLQKKTHVKKVHVSEQRGHQTYDYIWQIPLNTLSAAFMIISKEEIPIYVTSGGYKRTYTQAGSTESFHWLNFSSYNDHLFRFHCSAGAEH